MSTTVALWDHFKRLADFKGREDRASFWPYAAVAFVILMVVGFAIFIPTMNDSIRAMQEYARTHPDQVTVTSGPAEYSMSVRGNPPGMFPTGAIATYLVVSFGLAIILYAAAVTRRLHDRGMSGAWGLMPVPFIVYSSILMPRMFGSFGNGAAPDMSLFFSIFFSNMLYIITLIVLIVLLAGASDPQANRFDTGPSA
jgi:uncharacterized membrane protein YhaH (DUF805 family)